MSETTRDMLLRQLESTRELLDELWQRFDGDLNGPDDDEAREAAAEELDELPLEIVWEKGEPFAVVLGTGGPHVEIRGGTRHDGSSYSLHGYWAGEHVALHVSTSSGIARTGEYFREMVEES